MSEPQQPPQHTQPGQPYPQPGQPYSQPGQPYAQPGQPYSQPGQPYSQPGQPYSQPGQPYGTPVAPHAQAQSSASGSRGLGRTALIIAVVSVGVGLLFQMITPLLYASGGYGISDALSSVVRLLVLAGTAASLIMGIIALRRPAPRLLAAVAVGIAGSTVVSTLVSWMSSAFYYLGF